MNKSIAVLAAAALAIAALFLLLYSAPGQPAGFFSLFLAPAPNYSIDSLGVFQSGSTVIGSGTAVCTGIDVTGASAACDTNLLRSTDYRFELTISNSDWFQHGYPDQFNFHNVYAANDVIGSDATVSYCGCLDDTTYKAGTPSLSGNDVLCALPTVDQCRIEKSGGSESFYFVLSTGSDAATGSGNFFISETGDDDDTSADVTFSYCMIACDANADCDDGNSLTVDVCLNPGTCSASCSNTVCSIECTSDSACDDSNSLTTDTCLNPGTCDANCSHTVCDIACDNNAACDDSNSLTTDVCLNPGTCSASCSNTVCSIECTSDSACDDSNSLTTDTCLNPGTCDANCANTPIACTVACDANADCDDSNAMTVDVCLNPGTCDANCSSSLCAIACYSNADCDDNSTETVDVCNNAGTCDANCTHTVCTVACTADADCDDGIEATSDYCFFPGQCDSYCANVGCTVACSGDGDCFDDDPQTLDKCLNAGTCEASCSNTPCTIACSSTADCDDQNPITLDECLSPGTCSAACTHTGQQQLSIELLTDFNTVLRGQAIDLNVLVTDLEGEPIEGAAISLTDAYGNGIDLQDLGNGSYTGSYVVPVDLPIGKQSFSFFAAKGELAGLQELTLDINAGAIKAVLLQPKELKVSVSEKLEFKFQLVYANNAAVPGADVNAVLNGVSIPLQQDGNVFTGHYVFSDKDLPEAALVITAIDSLGNKGTTSFPFAVYAPLPIFLIALLLVLLVVILFALYMLKRMHKLFFLEHKRGSLAIAKKKAQLQKAVVKGKAQGRELEKQISMHEKEMRKAAAEISTERKRHVLAWKRLPSESRYAAHKTAVSASMLPAKLMGLFAKPGKPAEPVEAGLRLQEIDAEIAKLRDMVQNLETEFCKQTIKEDYFRQKLFEYREKIHLLELEKKKLQ